MNKFRIIFIVTAILPLIAYASSNSTPQEGNTPAHESIADKSYNTEQAITELRAAFWTRWFNTNNRKYCQEEHNNFYRRFTKETNRGSPSDTLAFLRIVAIFDSAKRADSIKVTLIERRKLFWTNWFINNQRYSQQEHNSFYKTYTEDFNTSDFAADTAQLIIHIRRYDSIKAADLLRERLEIQSFDRNYASTRKQFKHVKDKFGEYDYWERRSIIVSGGYRIDLIVSPPGSEVAHFFITKNTASCFDDDARIVFLLKNGSKVELESTSGFNCDGFFNSLTFLQNEFNAPIAAVRIDHGSNAKGFYDFSVSAQTSKALHPTLSKIEWLQTRLYNNIKIDHSN